MHRASCAYKFRSERYRHTQKGHGKKENIVDLLVNRRTVTCSLILKRNHLHCTKHKYTHTHQTIFSVVIVEFEYCKWQNIQCQRFMSKCRMYANAMHFKWTYSVLFFRFYSENRQKQIIKTSNRKVTNKDEDHTKRIHTLNSCEYCNIIIESPHTPAKSLMYSVHIIISQ